MKYTILYLFILLIATITLSAQNTKGNFEIKKIEKKKHVYKIVMQRNDSLFLILTNKMISNKSYENKIKKGNIYRIKIRSLHSPKDIGSSKITKITYLGVDIKIEKKYHSSVYMTNDVIGLCYIPKTEWDSFLN